MNEFFNLGKVVQQVQKLVPANLGQRSKRPPARLVALALDRAKLEVAVLKRANGGVEVQNAFSTPLSLDPLTDDPVLVGREIRKKLDAARIRERRCTVCIPTSWVMTLSVKLPDLPESDLQSLLELEAERGFPYAPETLVMAHSRYRAPSGLQYALVVAVPREHTNRLEAVLAAAQLRPVSFSLGITALAQQIVHDQAGAIALVASEAGLNVQVSCGGGIVCLRSIDMPAEAEPGGADSVTTELLRELRVTLGQLEPEIREAIRVAYVFGENDRADELAEIVGPYFARLGITLERVRHLAVEVHGVADARPLPASGATALAVLCTMGRTPMLEFLPPRVSAWQQFTARYSARRLARAGLAAAGVGAGLAVLFLYQQAQLVYWSRKWARIKPLATELELMQRQIKKFRPWYDDSFRSLNVLRRLAEAFPEDGTVSAKTVELRQPSTVTCSGTARDNAALLRLLDKLRSASEVANVHLEQTRGGAPLQFTFNFQWIERSGQ